MLVLDRQWKRDVTSLRWFFFLLHSLLLHFQITQNEGK